MYKIKFGTDGWRAIIAKDFTVENLARVAEGTAKWLLTNPKFSQFSTPLRVVVGHDYRFAGELFAQITAKVLAYHGIQVFVAKGFVSTPMVSLGTLKQNATLGIIITASHNPPSYNGFKLKGSYGGPLLPKEVLEIENLIPERPSVDVDTVSISHPLISYIDLEKLYLKQIEKSFDLKSIWKSKMNFAYDAMYGAGQNVIRKILPNTQLLHCDYNPAFGRTAPEPIAKNLKELSALVKRSKGKNKITCALATDGDADRLGLFDSRGNFVDSHHIILLLIHYLCKYKKMRGKVCVAFSTTSRIRKMCEHYGLPLQVVKIGFKYICEIMNKEDVLLGGEESGGIAIKGHIPERDGIWMGLTLFEFMAKSRKSLEELVKEVYAITGSFAFERNDLHLSEEIKNRIIENCRKGVYNSFGKYNVQCVEDLDGWKYFFNEEEWVMIRASGTEPVLRIYAESYTRKRALDILSAAKKTLLNL